MNGVVLNTVSTTFDADFEPASGKRLLLVDDHEVVHWGYKFAFSRCDWVDSCAAALGSTQALALAKRIKPDLAIVDVVLGHYSGVALSRELSKTTTVVLLALEGRVSSEMLEASRAVGVLGKSWPIGRFVAAAERAASGRSIARSRPAPPRQILSRREVEVLSLMAHGRTNAQIGSELGLSPWTVKQYLSSSYRKLGVVNRTQAVQVGRSRSLIE